MFVILTAMLSKALFFFFPPFLGGMLPRSVQEAQETLALILSQLGREPCSAGDTQATPMVMGNLC